LQQCLIDLHYEQLCYEIYDEHSSPSDFISAS